MALKQGVYFWNDLKNEINGENTKTFLKTLSSLSKYFQDLTQICLELQNVTDTNKTDTAKVLFNECITSIKSMVTNKIFYQFHDEIDNLSWSETYDLWTSGIYLQTFNSEPSITYFISNVVDKYDENIKSYKLNFGKVLNVLNTCTNYTTTDEIDNIVTTANLTFSWPKE